MIKIKKFLNISKRIILLSFKISSFEENIFKNSTFPQII